MKLKSFVSRLFSPKPHRVRVSRLPGGDQVVWGVEGEDMDRAIAAARETLPVFWAWHATRPDDDPYCCALKVAVPNPYRGHEHIWFIDIRRTGDLVSGIVGNEVESVPGLKQWQPTAVDMGLVSDWMFVQDGRQYGQFTVRALARMYPQAAPPDWDRDLSETPLPSDVVLH